VISYPRAERCRNGTPLIGPEALRPSGGVALRVGADGIDISSVRAARGDRPWTR
jgi:hypothetical protein